MANLFPLVRPATTGGVRNLAEATDVLLASDLTRSTAGVFNLCTATTTTLNVGRAACIFDLDCSTLDILAASTFSIDGTGASNISTTSGNLTVSTLVAGTLFVTSAGLLDIDAAANIDIDVTGTFDVLATSTFSIDGTGASNVSATSGNLTLSTITTGSLLFGASAAGNFGFNQTSFATSELGCLAIHSGTLPTAGWVADCAHIGVADRGGTAGKASVHLYCEDGAANVIGDLVGIGTITPSYKLDVNGYMYATNFRVSDTLTLAVVGTSSLASNTTGHNLAGLGYGVFVFNTEGYDNVAAGTLALRNNTTGSGCVAIGNQALYTNQISYYNTAIGDACLNLATGANNTSVGAYSGTILSTGHDNLFLGYRAGCNQTTNSNLLVVDNQDRTSAALEITNSLIYGTFDATPTNQTLRLNALVGIGCTPSSLLDLEKAGTVTATVDFLEITNTANAAAMTSTGTGILFNQFAYQGPELLVDGDMEAVGVAAWTASKATLTKEITTPHGGSQCLRVTAASGSGTDYCQAYQVVTTPGHSYLITGYARSDGTQIPMVIDGVSILWTGTTSTSWQSFSFTLAAAATAMRYVFTVTDPAGTEYVEFDDVSVVEAPAVCDAARIASLTEGNWLVSDVNTQDSALAFSTALNGTVTEWLRITSGGLLKDPNLTVGVGLSQGGTTGLVGFTATSIVAALNELKAGTGMCTLENTTIDIGYAEEGAASPDLEDVVTQTNGTVRARIFSSASVEDVVIPWRVPDDCKVASGVKFKVHGIITSSTAPAAGEGVSFKLSGYSRGTGDSLNGTFGTEIEANITDLDAVGVNAQYDLFSTAYSATVTITDLAVGELVMLHLERDTADADDDYAQDVGVIGITLEWSRTTVAGL